MDKAMENLRAILSLVDEIKCPTETGVAVCVDLGNILEQLADCEKACQNVIMAKK
jgi:hypothetical protein